MAVAGSHLSQKSCQMPVVGRACRRACRRACSFMHLGGVGPGH